MLHDLGATGQFGKLVLRLFWRSCPRLLLLLVALPALQAIPAPLELVFFRTFLDRAALDAGLGRIPDRLATRLSLSGWAVLAALGIVAGQLLGPVVQTRRDLTGDRLTASLGRDLIRAANRRQGLARFGDPGFADDLARART